MADEKRDELWLIELRGEVPLVRTKREFNGFPIGTLGYISGVDGPFIKVVFAGSNDSVSLLKANEVENA